MPLHRRVPKRGFRSPFPTEYAVVNVETLQAYSAGDTITPQTLLSNGIVRSKNKRVKILGEGELTLALTVHAHAFSKSAQQKITSAGGKFEILK